MSPQVKSALKGLAVYALIVADSFLAVIGAVLMAAIEIVLFVVENGICSASNLMNTWFIARQLPQVW